LSVPFVVGQTDRQTDRQTDSRNITNFVLVFSPSSPAAILAQGVNEGVSSLKCIVVYEVCSVFLLNGDRIRLTHSVCDHLRETPILHPGIVRVDGLPVQLPDALLDREKVCVSCGPWSLSGTRGIDSGLDLCERAESFVLVQAADLSDRTLSIAPGSRKRVALALDLSRLAHPL
jgi:hypothetical protein